MIKRIVLNRLLDNRNQTTGMAALLNVNYGLIQRFITIELPWKDNTQNISCIPSGEYNVVVRRSEKHGRHLQVLGVKDRTYILFHVANFYSDLRGCIGIGMDFKYINSDNNIDITNSRITFDVLMANINNEDEISLIITDAMMTK